MTSSVRLLFIAGSQRQASYNKRLARLGANIAEANGIAATFADLGDYSMPIYDGDIEASEGPPENAAKLKHLMSLHTGIFIASPEYMGGLRGLNTVRQVLELGLGALVLPEQFAVPRAANAFEENGHLKNKESQETLKALIQKLARAAHVLHG
jgi:chromate reductase